MKTIKNSFYFPTDVNAIHWHWYFSEPGLLFPVYSILKLSIMLYLPFNLDLNLELEPNLDLDILLYYVPLYFNLTREKLLSRKFSYQVLIRTSSVNDKAPF